ncbi:cellulase family glycosylhydrolase [Metabacillus litoralis]|uniref:cellulase n=2 Tax=Metabacillus litoralis TaxID=152268 RepID=A0A5C6VK57_9BACI|nr:cellulase family glycosylhydrolase [Metabacillus litoralis]
MLKKFTVYMMIFGLIASMLPSLAAAEESDYGSLLGNPGKKPSQAGALKLNEVNGQKTLTDSSGAPIQLRGMSTHGLQWFPEIINDNAFTTLSNDWGSNLIRLAMYVGENGYATNPEVKQKLIEGIELAIKHDMYVIVDWHVHAPGDPNEEVYSGALDFFDEISTKYKDVPNIIYEVANEPSSNSNGGDGVTNDEAGWNAVKSYAEPIIEKIRENGAENIVIVGSPNWSQRPDLAADNPINDENTMYTVHFYSGSHPAAADSSDRENVMSNARYALENGVGVFATEWGTSEANGNNGPYLDEADVWINFLNENNISWANWSLTNKNETSAAFTPFQLGKSEATDLDPGADHMWSPKELSISGEYVRARIKGVSYEPIDRTKFTEVLWNFNDGTSQGFGVNGDSPVKDITTTNQDDALKVSGLSNSENDLSEGNFWANARLSADAWGQSVDILGAEMLTMDVIVDQPTTVSIAAIAQGPSAPWVNPARAIQVNSEEFVAHGDQYKAVLTITKEDAPSLATIGESPDDSTMNNLVLFVGAENADSISLDNITVSGTMTEVEVINDPEGVATIPSTFEDDTRQGWKWSGDSGVKTALTIQEANGSKALSWDFAYPEVKPSDNWASAPRLDFWMDTLARGDNDYVAFDLYMDPTRASTGAIAVNLVFQPEALGYWAQAPGTYEINLEELDSAKKTSDGLYHFEAKIDVSTIENLQDDTLLRNMLLIFADVESDFGGTMYVDNVRFEKADPGTGGEEGETPAPNPGEGEGETPAPGTGEGEGEAPAPNTGEEEEKAPSSDKDKDKEGEVPTVEKVSSGKELPDTATSSYSTLLVGSLLFLAGIMSYFFIKRRISVSK